MYILFSIKGVTRLEQINAGAGLLRNVCETFQLKIDAMSYTLFFIYPRHATVLKSSTNHYKSLTRHKCINSFARGMQK